MEISKILKNQDGCIRLIWRMVIFFCCFIAITILSIFAGIIFYFIYRALIELKLITSLSEQNVRWMFIALLTPVKLVLFVTLICVLRKYIDKKKITTIGIVKLSSRVIRRILLGLAIGVIMLSLYLLIMILSGQYSFSGIDFPWISLALLPVLILAAFEEELVFRGYIFRNFIDEKRIFTGIIISSLIFALVHCGNPAVFSNPLNLINLFLAGIFFAQAYQISNELWFPTAIHFAWNATQGLLFGLPVSGMTMRGLLNFKATETENTFLSGGKFGPEGSYVITIVLLLWIIGAAIYIHCKNKRIPDPKESDNLGINLIGS